MTYTGLSLVSDWGLLLLSFHHVQVFSILRPQLLFSVPHSLLATILFSSLSRRSQLRVVSTVFPTSSCPAHSSAHSHPRLVSTPVQGWLSKGHYHLWLLSAMRSFQPSFYLTTQVLLVIPAFFNSSLGFWDITVFGFSPSFPAIFSDFSS